MSGKDISAEAKKTVLMHTHKVYVMLRAGPALILWFFLLPTCQTVFKQDTGNQMYVYREKNKSTCLMDVMYEYESTRFYISCSHYVSQRVGPSLPVEH